jgi:hypothetical protein
MRDRSPSNFHSRANPRAHSGISRMSASGPRQLYFAKARTIHWLANAQAAQRGLRL